MSRPYTRIPQDTFDALQVDAGILLKSFDPSDPDVTDSDIITATTGGIKIDCVPEYEDWGEDVDNCPNNMLELKTPAGWDCKVSTTAIGTSPEMIRLSLGAADVSGSKITPRATLKREDFSTLWWVGDKADGGFVAVKLFNALSTGGFSLQTTKKGKGQTSLELTGHVSLAAQDLVPMEFYSISGPSEGETTYTYTAVTPSGNENPTEEGWYVLIGDAYRLSEDTEVDSNVTYYERTSN